MRAKTLIPLPRICIAALFVSWLTGGTATAADSMRDVNQFVATAMREWQIPGFAVAVVKDDKVVLARGYGVRQVGRSERVDENTTFGIGSATKSFTATAAAMLVNEGKMKWDAPVIDYIPALHFSDAWITSHGTVRDLAAHRVGIDGLPTYFLIGGSLERTVRNVRYIILEAPFRTFYYSNTGYALLGKVIENVSGEDWDTFITERILKPLNMRHSYSSEYAFIDRANLARCWLCVPKAGTPLGVDALRDPLADVAVPHGLFPVTDAAGKAALEPRVLPWRSERAVASAGMIHASASDMAQYLRLHLANGQLDGAQLVSKAQMHQLHSPQALMHVPGEDAALLAYGMGWMIGTYHDFPVVHHAGGRVGFGADMWLFPAQKLGVVVLENVDYRDAPLQRLALRFADHFLGVPSSRAAQIATLTRSADWTPVSTRHAECRDPQNVPAVAERLAGKYRSDLLGEAQVAINGNRAELIFEPQSVADLFPADHETFTVCFRGYEQAPARLRFVYDASNDVTGLLLDEPASDVPSGDLAWARATSFKREQ